MSCIHLPFPYLGRKGTDKKKKCFRQGPHPLSVSITMIIHPFAALPSGFPHFKVLSLMSTFSLTSYLFPSSRPCELHTLIQPCVDYCALSWAVTGIIPQVRGSWRGRRLHELHKSVALSLQPQFVSDVDLITQTS